MKIIINLVIASSLLLAVNSFGGCDEIYLKVGAGYKFEEKESVVLMTPQRDYEYDLSTSPYSARFEGGIECGNLTWGISHHSQWANGAPFNNEWEYYKTEFFIDYKISWGL